MFKILLLTLILFVFSCGNKEEFGHPLVKKADANKPSARAAKLEVDARTITNEVPIIAISKSANFIKDLSKVDFREVNSHFIIKDKYLYQFTMMDNLKIGMQGNLITQMDSNFMILSFSAIHLRKINLQTFKVEETQIIDNFFNKQSVFPANDGEYWGYVSKSFDAGKAIYLFNKAKIKTVNCPYKKDICSVYTDEYMIAHYDFVTKKIRPLKAVRGKFSSIRYIDSTAYLTGGTKTELKVNSFNLSNGSTNDVTVSNHQIGQDHISLSYFNKGNFYITGLWTKNAKVFPEIMKFDRDLNIQDEIVFNDQLSGPDYNIDVLTFEELNEENYFSYLHAGSMGQDSILVLSSYLIAQKKMVTDIAVIDSNNGQVAKYFNKGKVLRIEEQKKELYFNDSNYLYIFKVEGENLILTAYSRDGVLAPINDAKMASFQLDPSLKNTSVSFISIENGVATVVLNDKTKSYIKRFNIH